MWLVTRTADNYIQALNFPTQADAERAMIELLNSPEPPRIYRVILRDSGDVILRPLRVQTGSIVTRAVVDSATFEDDI